MTDECADPRRFKRRVGAASGSAAEAATAADAPSRPRSSASQLNETARQLNAIINNTKMAIFMMDEQQQCVFMNSAAEELTGYTFAETQGGPLHDVIHHKHPDGRPYPLSECPIDRAFPEENQVEGEEVFVHKDGHFYPVAFTASPIRDSAGKPIGTVIEARNVQGERARDVALRENEQRFRAVFENAGVGMLEFDSEWRILGANRVYVDITGYSTDELIGQSCLAFTHPDDRDRSREALRSVISGESAGFSFEKRYIRKDGEITWIRSNLTRLADDSSRFLKIVEDISEAKAADMARRAAERKLRASEAHLSALLEQTAAGVAETDLEGRFVKVNDRYCEMLDRTREELLGLRMQDVTHPDDLPQNLEFFTRAVETGEPFDIEKRYLRSDGSIVWVSNTVSRIRSGDGAPGTILAVSIDITERKATETALREESHNLEILNSVGTALAGELDLERVVQMVTDAGVDLTGAKLGAFFYNVVDEAGESYMLYTLSGAERSQFEGFGMPRKTKVFAPTFDGEGIFRSDDITSDPRYGHNPPHHGMPKGHLPVRSYLAVPVVGRTGEVIGGLFFGHPEPGQFIERHERLMAGIAAQAAVAIDNARLFLEAQREIDQRVKAEQALTALNETLESRVLQEIERRSQAEEALRQTQKMETVGQLSGGIAHDFNNLLQVIHGNLSLLKQSLPADEAKWQRAVTNALTGSERAAALTRRLLAFSRRQPLDPRPVDINRLVGDMSELLRRTLGETVEVEMDLSAEDAVAEIDPNQLENSILNLAVNARDAMPGGGKLEITTAAAEIDEGFVQLHPDAVPGDYVCLTVNDSGEGMNAETLSRAVEPFFTTKEVGRGTGLGLSMVYGFVKQSGGYLSLRSKVGEGTSVDLFLPRARGEAHAEPEREQKELPRGSGETILLCEDEEDVRRFSADSLRELGYEVLEAEDAESALRLLRKSAPVDLMFTDVVLPGGKTGAELAREAREIQPGLKILFTTGYARSALDETAIDAAVELLPKPFSIEDLANRLKLMLR